MDYTRGGTPKRTVGNCFTKVFIFFIASFLKFTCLLNGLPGWFSTYPKSTEQLAIEETAVAAIERRAPPLTLMAHQSNLVGVANLWDRALDRLATNLKVRPSKITHTKLQLFAGDTGHCQSNR